MTSLFKRHLEDLNTMLWKFPKFVLSGAYYKAVAIIRITYLIGCYLSLECWRDYNICSKTKLSVCDICVQVRIAKSCRSCNC